MSTCMCRAVAKLAEDPEFHMTLKLEPGDIELIHNPYAFVSDIVSDADASTGQCMWAATGSDTSASKARAACQKTMEARSVRVVCPPRHAIRS